MDDRIGIPPFLIAISCWMAGVSMWCLPVFTKISNRFAASTKKKRTFIFSGV
jgi:hypothetical protein